MDSTDASPFAFRACVQFMRRAERAAGGRLGGGESSRSTPSLFQFRLVDRLQCRQSGTVKYTTQAADNMLSLQVSYSVLLLETSVAAARNASFCLPAA